MDISYIDFDPNDPDGDDNEWVEVAVGKPGEQLVLLEMQYTGWEGYIITAMSNKRSIYMSKDQGVTWEFDRRAGYFEYWMMRVEDKWRDLVIIAKWAITKMRIWWWQIKERK